jgi:Rab3 GTPase-activating protein catalytic subunit
VSFAFSSGKLAICIERKNSLNREKGAGHKDETSTTTAVTKTRKGSAGVVPKMMLLNTFQEMHAPYTQFLRMHL